MINSFGLMGFHIDYPCGLAMWVCFCFNTVILIKYMNAGKKKGKLFTCICAAASGCTRDCVWVPACVCVGVLVCAWNCLHGQDFVLYKSFVYYHCAPLVEFITLY